MHHVTEYSRAKTGEYPSDIPLFSKPHVLQKIFEAYSIASIWRENIPEYLFLGCWMRSSPSALTMGPPGLEQLLHDGPFLLSKLKNLNLGRKISPNH